MMFYRNVHLKAIILLTTVTPTNLILKKGKKQEVTQSNIYSSYVIFFHIFILLYFVFLMLDTKLIS